MNALAALAVAALFGAGIQLMVERDAVRIAAGTLLLTNAVVLLLISAGFGSYAVPILPAESVFELSDPLVQALGLTAVVIGFGTTVLLLRIVLAVERSHDTIDVRDLVDAEISEGEEHARDVDGEAER